MNFLSNVSATWREAFDGGATRDAKAMLRQCGGYSTAAHRPFILRGRFSKPTCKRFAYMPVIDKWPSQIDEASRNGRSLSACEERSASLVGK